MKIKQQQPEHSDKARGLSFRAVEVETVESEGNAPMVRMSVSSETPVLTWVAGIGRLVSGKTEERVNDSGITEYLCYEILDHSESSIDRSRCFDGLVIKDTHRGDQVGLIRAPVITNRKLGGMVEFCTGERAQEIGMDAVKRLRKNCSVGYTADHEKYVLDGDFNGYPLARCLRWCPHEASFEPIPADVNVGVGRSLENEHSAVVADETERENHMDPKEMAKLFERAAKFGIAADKVTALVADGKGRAELDAMIVDAQAENDAKQRAEIQALKERSKPEMPQRTQQPVITDGGQSSIPEKEMRKYSLLNVCRSFAGDRVDIGREREISQECAKIREKPVNGLIIPFAALANRAFSVSGTSSASVATNLYPDEFIELLKDRYLLGKLGCDFMPGAVGNVSYPRMSSGSTCYHVSEGGSITASEPALEPVTGSPHTIGTLVDITRRMMEQSTPKAEQMVRDEILDRVMLGVQTDVFAGTGSDGQPSAITTATGINNPSVTQGTPTYAEILKFIGDVEADNAAADGQKWAMTSEVMVKLASTMRNATYGEIPILDPEKPTMLGRQWFQSEGLPANSLWFGNWKTVVIPIWGAGVEIAADTAKLFASGGLTLRALLDFDVMVRQGKALAYNTAVTV